MKNRILRTAVILAAAATLFYSGCGDNGASSGVTGGGNVDALINRTRGTNDPKAPVLYTLNVTENPADGGSVSKSPNKAKYTNNETVMVIATPETGYRFAGWSGSQMSPDDQITVTMDGNKELVANFMLENVASYSLTVNANPVIGGSVSQSPNKLEYATGEAVMVTATPEPGYTFTGWSGASASKDATETIVMDGNKELTANFAQQTYTLTINADPPAGGSVSCNPGKNAYNYNEEVTVTATAKSGYEFTGWSGASTSADYVITITVDDDKELTANFEWQGTEPPPNVPDPTYTLTAYASPENGGTVSANPYKTSYSANESVYVTTEAAVGYRFAGWSGASGSQEAGVTIVMNEDKELIANFERLTYTLTVSANPSNGGSVSRSPDYERYNHGTLVTVTASAYSNYTFTGWTGASSTSASVTVTMDGNKALTAKFEQIPTYTVTFDANGGTVNPTSGTTGTDGKLAPLPTPTRTGYTFNGWYTATTGGTVVTTSTVFSATATIYAQWTEEVIVQPTTYTLTISASDGGSVSPSVGEHKYDEGTSVTVTASANTGYTFKNWTGESSSTSSTINITMNGNKTLTANFQQNDTPPSGNTFVDSRDGKTYKKVVIGTQTWMAENLNYDVPGVTTDVCYGNSADSCAKYGRLYNWSTAMGGASSSSLSPSGVQGVCPAGWHLPSSAEWDTLRNFVGGSSTETAGKKLKSVRGWYNNGNGTDEYGFSALPGGHDIGGYGRFESGDGNWWSATRSHLNNDYASYRQMSFKYEYVYTNTYNVLDRISVRCVEDY
jgi:uncharacterized protein (TIGR02145 family)/uncharacterized repeat protein (TIGR02543 family)